MLYDVLSFLDSGSRKPLMAIVQFFCDEGGKYQSPHAIVSFCGLVISPSKLKDFDEEWQPLLRSCGLSFLHTKNLADRGRGFSNRFRENRTLEETIENLKPFADCINKHFEFGLAQAWDVLAYSALPELVKNRLGGSARDPHYLAFARALSELKKSYISGNHKIGMVCDDDLQKAFDCYLHYRAVCRADDEIKDKFAALTFAHSEDFPALQAADMWAFLARLEAIERLRGEKNEWKTLFSYLIAERPLPVGLTRWSTLFADEPTLAKLANVLENSN